MWQISYQLSNGMTGNFAYRDIVMDAIVKDNERALVLWARLRTSNYINTFLILMLFVLSQHYLVFSESAEVVFFSLLVLSHLNYHYQLSTVSNILLKNSNWWAASFFTFPLGPLISYQLMKPVAIRSGLSI